MKKPATEQVITRLAGPLAVWAITQLLQRPSVRGAMRRVDSRVMDQGYNARRQMRRVGKNMRSNPVWVAAGVVTIAIGIGMITYAARRA